MVNQGAIYSNVTTINFLKAQVLWRQAFTGGKKPKAKYLKSLYLFILNFYWLAW